MSRSMPEDTPAVYRIKMSRTYPPNGMYLEPRTYVHCAGPYSTLAVANNRASRIRATIGPDADVTVEFARTEWEAMP